MCPLQTQQGDYFEVLASLKKTNYLKICFWDLILVCTDEMAAQFIYNLSATLKAGDNIVGC
jgi:hypothetical protein